MLAIPAAVASAVPTHQIWRATSAALSTPGNSGASPSAGASAKLAYPAIPHTSPCFHERAPRHAHAVASSNAKPKAPRQSNSAVLTTRSRP